MFSECSTAATLSVAAEEAAPCSHDPRLYFRDGEGLREATGAEVLERARALIAEHFRPGAPVLDAPNLVETFLSAQLGSREREVFAMILLDGHNRLIEYVELFYGSLASTEVHRREVVKAALKGNAAGVILVHNHPSGCSHPSFADIEQTRRLKAALAMVDVRVIDHFIVGETVTSFARRGLLS